MTTTRKTVWNTSKAPATPMGHHERNEVLGCGAVAAERRSSNANAPKATKPTAIETAGHMELSTAYVRIVG